MKVHTMFLPPSFQLFKSEFIQIPKSYWIFAHSVLQNVEICVVIQQFWESISEGLGLSYEHFVQK